VIHVGPEGGSLLPLYDQPLVIDRTCTQVALLLLLPPTHHPANLGAPWPCYRPRPPSP
jgi:hypothetical protein